MGAGRAAPATSGQDGPAASLASASHHRRRPHVLRAGCAWHLLSVEHFPSWRTVYWWFRRLLANGPGIG
jgi:transposase